MSRLYLVLSFSILICLIGALWGREELLDRPYLPLFFIPFVIFTTYLDARMLELVIADPSVDRQRIKRRAMTRMAINICLTVVFMVLVVPATYYYVMSRPSDCRAWSAEIHQDRLELAKSTEGKNRFYILTEAAKAATEVGSYAEAERYATEVLQLAPNYRRDWNYGNAIHDGHMTLGRVALARGDRATARGELLKAGLTPGSPQLDSFGPNMSLAREMLQEGEREAVFQYFDECDRFWHFGHSSLKRWRKLAEWHLPPDFGANLLY